MRHFRAVHQGDRRGYSVTDNERRGRPRLHRSWTVPIQMLYRIACRIQIQDHRVSNYLFQNIRELIFVGRHTPLRNHAARA